MNIYRLITCLTPALPVLAVASGGTGTETHYPQRTEYRAPLAETAPRVDGVADDAAWQLARWQPIVLLEMPEPAAGLHREPEVRQDRIAEAQGSAGAGPVEVLKGPDHVEDVECEDPARVEEVGLGELQLEELPKARDLPL